MCVGVKGVRRQAGTKSRELGVRRVKAERAEGVGLKGPAILQEYQ